MPSEIMEKRPLSSFYMESAPSSLFSCEIRLPTERQVGFWKPESVPDYHETEGTPLTHGSKSVSVSPREEVQTINSRSPVSLENPYYDKELKNNFCADHHSAMTERMARLSATPWKTTEQDPVTQPNIHRHPASLYTDTNENGFQYENGLFSCSFSEVFNRKLNLSSDSVFWQSPNVMNTQSFKTVNAKVREGEPFESSEEIEAHMIGDLLPGDDELLSGLIDDLEFIPEANDGDDLEDDLFYSGGGMELEADVDMNCSKKLDVACGPTSKQQGIQSIPVAGEHPYGEHPSRTLFVRNINSNVEDSELRSLFEHYGDIRTIYTACKHRGFVMISYYDIRSARNAMRALQNKPLRRRKLDIHFSIPKDNPSEKDINQGTLVVFNLDSSVSNDDLHQIFGVYGEIKEIRETPHKHHHKFIEFYDVRAAEAALRALNRSDIAGKRIKLEPSRPGGARRCSIQLFSPEVETEEANGCPQEESPLNSSPSVGYGSVPVGVTTPNVLDVESFRGILSTDHSPTVPVLYKFPETSSTISHSMTSLMRVESVGDNSSRHGLHEQSRSLGHSNFGFQSMSPLHSCSLTKYHGGLANGISFSSASTMPSMAININPTTTKALDTGHAQNMAMSGPNKQLHEHDENALRTLGNMSCPLHGHQYLWGNSNSYHYHNTPGHVMWLNSPSLVNNISAPPSQLHLSRAPSAHLLNTVVPLHQHHIGSAPSVNPSLWDRQSAYTGDATDAPGFRPGSLGSMGFPGSPTLHAFGVSSQNVFSPVGGNYMDQPISSHVGMPSPQQRGHMFHGRNSLIPMPATLNVPNERFRSRRSDAIANQADNKKQYELDIERIIRGEDSRTTLMIKNIPNKYTSKMLLVAIDENHRGTYDFIYLPIDFKNKCNVGYAFINMTDPQQIIPFFKTFNGKKWEKFNSEKVASLAYARIQGKPALVAHFQNSSLMNEDKRCRPILFHTDGPNAGDQEPFPMGINIRPRPGRIRATNEDSNQESTADAAIDEHSSGGTGISPALTEDLERPNCASGH